jgi:hypothetical protein
MSEDKKDWNAIFAEEYAAHKGTRAQELAEAKQAAADSGKEPFDHARFRELYEKLRADDVTQYTPWDTLLEESERDYYVGFPDQKTLEEFIRHQDWLDGFG